MAEFNKIFGNIIGSKTYEDDHYGTTLSNKGSAGRKTFLFFGNSISKLNIRQKGGFTTKSVANTLSGGTVLNVQASNNLAVNDKVVVTLNYGGYFYSTITATDNLASTSNVTIADRLPRPFIGGQVCFIEKYTTDKCSDLRQVQGPYASAIAQLGHPVDILPGYGHIGAKMAEMLIDLPVFLEFYRPDYVGLVLFENDIKAGATAAYCIQMLNQAINLCINAGAIPIIFSCVPQTGFTAGNRTVFDELLAYVMRIRASYPSAIPIDMSTPWQDVAGGLRAPLAGWTDGTHPNPLKFAAIGRFVKPYLEPVLGTRNTYSDLALAITDMTGIGGTLTNATGVAAAGVTIAGHATVWSTVASKDSRDCQRIAFTNLLTSTNANVSVTAPVYTLPLTSGGQYIKGFVNYDIAALSNMSKFQLSMTFSDNTVFYCGVDSLTASEPAFLDSKGMETCAVKIPFGVTTVTMRLSFESQTGFAPGAAGADVTIKELGYCLTAGEINDKVF